MFNKKLIISLINTKWETIETNIVVDSVPIRDEFIYIEKYKKYFQVLNIIHKITNKQSIFVVVSELGESLKNVSN